MPPKKSPKSTTLGVNDPSTPGDRHAVGTDPEIKASNLKRLNRIAGQVRGLQQMIEQERYCGEVITQISAVRQALRAVGREVMRNHLQHCASDAIRGSDDQARAMYKELLDLMDKNAR